MKVSTNISNCILKHLISTDDIVLIAIQEVVVEIIDNRIMTIITIMIKVSGSFNWTWKKNHTLFRN